MPLDLITATNVAPNGMAHPVHFTCSCVRSCYVWCSVTPQTVTVLVHSMAVRNLLATHSPFVARLSEWKHVSSEACICDYSHGFVYIGIMQALCRSHKSISSRLRVDSLYCIFLSPSPIISSTGERAWPSGYKNLSTT